MPLPQSTNLNLPLPGATSPDRRLLDIQRVKTSLELLDTAVFNLQNTGSSGINTATQTALDTKVSSTSVGSANGIASLDSNGLVPATQLPSFVDDILEFTDLNDFPVSGETGKIYVDSSTSRTYRWSGSTYTQVTSGAVDSVAGKTGVISLTSTDLVDSSSIPRKNTVSVFTKPQRGVDLLTPPDGSGVVTLDLDESADFNFTANQNITLANPLGLAGAVTQTGTITVIIGGAGNYGITFGSEFVSDGGIRPTLTATVGAIDIFLYRVLANGKILINKGFSNVS